MSAIPGPWNPIVYAQFNIQGRWKKLLTYMFVYAVLIGGAIWLSSANDDSSRHIESIKGWLGGLVALQTLNMMLFGGFRVESAVRGEITSRMIESHRLMPTPPLGSILGYILGAPLQAYLIFIANFLLGTACCMAAHVSLDAWALVNGSLLCFALFIYSIITQHALLARGGFAILIISAVIMISGANDSSIRLFASISVLISPLLGQNSVFEHLFIGSAVSSVASFAYLCSFLGQVIIAGICIRISIRRYMTANAIGISPVLGLMMLATWVGLAMVDFASPASFQFYRRYGRSDVGYEQVVTAFVTSLLLATLPIASAAKTVAVLRRTGRDSLAGGKFGVAAVTLVAGAIICCLLLETSDSNGQRAMHLYQTLMILLPFLTGISCVFCWGYLAKLNAWVFAVLWIVVTWIGPLVVDAVHDNPDDSTGITSFSPAGAISLLWSRPDVNLVPGIIGQCSIALVPIALLMLAQRRRRAR